MEQFIMDNQEVVVALITALIYEGIAHSPVKSNSIVQLIINIGKAVIKKIMEGK
jgi:hypothetical protein